KMLDLGHKIGALDLEIHTIEAAAKAAGSPMDQSTHYQKSEYYTKKVNLDSYTKELRRLKEDFNVTSDSGDFSLRAPALVANATRLDDALWKVLNGKDFKGELEGKPVKPGDPLLQIGDINGVWEVEIKIPQKHIGQVYAAFAKIDQDDELDVDLKLESH